jgi:hypothetical protein
MEPENRDNDVLSMVSEISFAGINGRLIMPDINRAFMVCGAAFSEKAVTSGAVKRIGRTVARSAEYADS